jgi:hypothetical protein
MVVNKISGLRALKLFWSWLWRFCYASRIVCAATHIDCWFLSGNHDVRFMKSEKGSAKALVIARRIKVDVAMFLREIATCIAII